MEITLRQLRYLISLADEGHFGRAAAAVNVSQPALSVQIRELEARLGVALVERRARRATLTPAGREVLQRARRIADEVRELHDAVRRERGLGGRLRIGVIPTVAPYLLPVALPMMRARNIGLDLGVREARTHVLLSELAQGDLDAVVIALPAPTPDLAATPLFDDRFLLAGCPATLAGLGNAPPRPEAMSPNRLLLLDDGHCLADQALAVCGLARDATRVDMRASSLATLCRLVEEGFGLTLLPEIAVRTETAAAPGLTLLRFSAPEPMRRIGLARRRSDEEAGWFDELAALLRAAGRAVLDQPAGAAEACMERSIVAKR